MSYGICSHSRWKTKTKPNIWNTTSSSIFCICILCLLAVLDHYIRVFSVLLCLAVKLLRKKMYRGGHPHQLGELPWDKPLVVWVASSRRLLYCMVRKNKRIWNIHHSCKTDARTVQFWKKKKKKGKGFILYFFFFLIRNLQASKNSYFFIKSLQYYMFSPVKTPCPDRITLVFLVL